MSSESPEMAPSTGSGFSASEPPGNQGPVCPKLLQSDLRRDLAFEHTNEVTWKLTDGRGSIAWSGNRGAGYRTTRAVAWLMLIGNGRWIVRHRNTSSKPMKLRDAKQYAGEMVKGVRPARIVDDPIGNLNRLQCIVEECNAERVPS